VADRTRLERLQQGLQLGLQVRIGGAAPAVGGAVSHQQIESASGVDAHVERQLHRDRRQPVENDRAHAVRMSPQIDETRPRAIRPAPEIDRLIPERLTHVVQVVHGHWCRVEPGIGVELARQRVRGTGAALVHEDEVPFAVDLPERSPGRLGELARGLPWATCEDEERVRESIA
jgi:hypothetical protein